MTLDEFLNWIFQEYPNTFTESQILEKINLYENTLKPYSDFDFHQLQLYLVKEWTSYKMPSPAHLLDLIRKNPKSTCEAIAQARANKTFADEHRDEILEAMRECMAHYEHITGRKIRRSGLCS